jgi:hypothetical protein
LISERADLILKARAALPEGEGWARKSSLLYFEGDPLPPLEEVIESDNHSKMQAKSELL